MQAGIKMMVGGGNGGLTVPPGFRFHPTDEELLYYYLRKKVSYEAIDLDVIREVDLNKLEPWDLKDKCRIGSGPQNEWYFFSHKDKKYPTGTRTNRATMAGFWKATGRDKAIHLITNNSKRIGMRKTLVFYTGRAPHGQKTDWIMHEYRLDDDHHSSNIDHSRQEDGWVVCRVFKKKNQTRCFQVDMIMDHNDIDHHHHQQQQQDDQDQHHQRHHHLMMNKIISSSNSAAHHDHYHDHHLQPLYDTRTTATAANYNSNGAVDASMHLPQLFSPESAQPPPFISPGLSLNSMDLECSQSLLRLTSGAATSLMQHQQQTHDDQRTTSFHGGDWSFLDKLLASSSHGRSTTTAVDHQQQQQISNKSFNPSSLFLHVGHDHMAAGAPAAMGHHHQQHPHSKFPFGQYLGCEPDLLKFSK